jgi:hypothetical protein
VTEEQKRNFAAAVALMKEGRKEVDAEVEHLVTLYAKAESDLTFEVLKVLSQPDAPLKWRKRRLVEVRAILKRVDTAAMKRIRGVVKDSFRLGARTAKRTQVFGDQTTFSRVNREAVDILVENLEGRLGAATQTVGRRVEDVFRREQLRYATRQIVTNVPLPYTSGEMARTLRRRKATAFVDKSGREWGLESYAEMAIKTTQSDAVAQGTQNAMLDRGFDLAAVNSVVGPCHICKPFDGKTYSLTGQTEGYERLVELPPFHPRCRHFILPAVEAADHRLPVAA